MNELIVIKYTGKHNKWGNLENIANSFKRDSGIAPLFILNEENQEVVIQQLDNYDNLQAHLIVHVQSHGFIEGLCMETVEDPFAGRVETLIKWKDFVETLNNLSLRCRKLTVNLLTVCNSDKLIINDPNINFDLLYTIVTVSDTTGPRKINKRVFEGTDLLLQSNYKFIARKPKTALAVWHSAGKGKSDSIREFAYALLSSYPHYTLVFTSAPVIIIPPTGDFRLVVSISNIIIAIESQGDPRTELQKRLHELIDWYNSDVILCTCRTRGETVNAVESLIPRSFEIIWSSTYHLDGRSQQAVANTIKGKHLLELLQILRKI